MHFDRKHLACSLAYSILGIGLGIFMAATRDFAQREVHVHVLLVGFVLSLGYGAIYKLWLDRPKPIIAKAQFIAHQGGAVVLCASLFARQCELASGTVLEPMLAASSISVFVGVLLMAYLVLNYKAKPSPEPQ